MPGNEYCFEHDSLDTDGDGECAVYATAPFEMQCILSSCRFERTFWEWLKWKIGLGP